MDKLRSVSAEHNLCFLVCGKETYALLGAILLGILALENVNLDANFIFYAFMISVIYTAFETCTNVSWVQLKFMIPYCCLMIFKNCGL